MHWAKVVYIALLIVDLVVCIIKSGEPRPDYSAASGIIEFGLAIFLLSEAGFFA